MGNGGKRAFIQVLRLTEAMPKDVVASAVTDAIRLGAIGFDAVTCHRASTYPSSISAGMDEG